MKTTLPALLLTLLVAAVSAQEYRTLEIRGRRPLVPGETEPGVRHPRPPIYVLLEDGRPLVSEAGFLQLADEGEGFYYDAALFARAGQRRAATRLGTNNWGAVEAMGIAGRVVRDWQARHPDVRLGLGEISSRLGGFPDYDGDGISDHLTHQAGMNVNFLLPCRRRPEVMIHLGRGANEELFEAALFGDLVDILVAAGAANLTTNAATGLLADPRRAAAFAPAPEGTDAYAALFRHRVAGTRLYLLAPPGDHGDHVNALLWAGR